MPIHAIPFLSISVDAGFFLNLFLILPWNIFQILSGPSRRGAFQCLTIEPILVIIGVCDGLMDFASDYLPAYFFYELVIDLS